MKSLIHTADSRGNADHGWLKSRHTFSFADYYNEDREQFGALRVINDDFIDGGNGFDLHPHRNMEIITIPLSGSLKHQDSMGNTSIISRDEIQLMSAGSGVRHSEYNASDTQPINLLQIWVIPNVVNTTPSYAEKTLIPDKRKNKINTFISPGSVSDSLAIKQDAYFSLVDLEAGKTLSYPLYNQDNGVYIFIIQGEVNCEGTILGPRDAMGIIETETISLTASQNAEVLIMEVPVV